MSTMEVPTVQSTPQKPCVMCRRSPMPNSVFCSRNCQLNFQIERQDATNQARLAADNAKRAEQEVNQHLATLERLLTVVDRARESLTANRLELERLNALLKPAN